MSTRHDIMAEMYALAPQITISNGFTADWSVVKSWENGAMICQDSPQFHLRWSDERNNDITNGMGNNSAQVTVELEVRFGATLSAPSDDLEVVDFQLSELKSDLLDDMFRAFATNYKINNTKYCGSEYVGEETELDEELELDPYTVIGKAMFGITYKRDRGINEW